MDYYGNVGTNVTFEPRWLRSTSWWGHKINLALWFATSYSGLNMGEPKIWVRLHIREHKMSNFLYSSCGERNSGTTKFPKLSPSKLLLQKLHKFFSQVFDLTPMFGTLAPFQSQVLNVAFQPQAFMGVVVTAVCTVLGGPTETIRLSGQNARHIYSLSTTFINFGFRVSMSE